jgi:hypothetical protein
MGTQNSDSGQSDITKTSPRSIAKRWVHGRQACDVDIRNYGENEIPQSNQKQSGKKKPGKMIDYIKMPDEMGSAWYSCNPT